MEDNSRQNKENIKHIYYPPLPELIKLQIHKSKMHRDFETETINIAASGFDSKEALDNITQLIKLAKEVKL
jgi:hypothetical protein